MLSYLKRSGDKTLAELAFNCVDNLILSQLSYCVLDRCASMLPCPLKELRGLPEWGVNLRNRELFNAACDSARFGDCVALAYHNEFSERQNVQFSAITFLLPDGSAYVAFRGTDSTLVGWKEDFMLCCYREVPAQKLAAEYLDHAAALLGCPLRVGGHSKGGNLAVYASAFCSEHTRALIKEIWSNDGPGFVKEVLESEQYARVRPLIKKLIPESSVFGRLLENDVPETVVSSDRSGLYQHDAYSWKTEGNGFVTVEHTDRFSDVMKNAFASWLDTMDFEKRRFMTDTLFDLLGSGDGKTLGDLKTPANLFKVVTAAAKLEPEDRRSMYGIIDTLLRSTGRNTGQAVLDIIDEKAGSAAKKLKQEDTDND